jgi:hypothetical protein
MYQVMRFRTYGAADFITNFFYKDCAPLELNNLEFLVVGF